MQDLGDPSSLLPPTPVLLNPRRSESLEGHEFSIPRSSRIASVLSKSAIIQNSPQPSPRITTTSDSPGVSPGMRGERRRRLFIDVTPTPPPAEYEARKSQLRENPWWKTAFARKPSSGHLGAHIHSDEIAAAASDCAPAMIFPVVGVLRESPGVKKIPVAQKLFPFVDSANSFDASSTTTPIAQRSSLSSDLESGRRSSVTKSAKRRLFESESSGDAAQSSKRSRIDMEEDPHLLPAAPLASESHWGVHSRKNLRSTNQDRYAIFTNLNDAHEEAFYGVFDGHGGYKVAEYCASHLCNNILHQDAFPHDLVTAVTEGFLKTDAEVASLAEPSDYQGTTAVVCLVRGRRMVVASVGDSRAVLVKRSGEAVQLTRDHRPSEGDERERVLAAGGGLCGDRVNGILAMTRAIGDNALKQFVIAKPDILLRENEEEDAYLVLASDGLWDGLSNASAARVVLESQRAPQLIAEELVQKAIENGSKDNCTALVLKL